jgi:hypothetical protein
VASYRFYFMHGGTSTTRAVNCDCGSDDEARRHALDLLEAWPVAAAIEVWEPDDTAIEVWELGSLGAWLPDVNEGWANRAVSRSGVRAVVRQARPADQVGSYTVQGSRREFVRRDLGQCGRPKAQTADRYQYQRLA